MYKPIRCPVCAASELETVDFHVFSEAAAENPGVKQRVATYIELFEEPGSRIAEVSIQLCASCSFLFTSPRLTEADLDRKYATIAAADVAARRGRPPHLAGRRTRTTPLLQKLLAEATSSSGKVLDYGGAEGYLLSPLIDAGHRGFVADYIDYPREDDRIQYLGQKFGPELDAAGPFDCIMALHTLEHVADPVRMIRQLGGLLAPSGYLYLEVPLGAWLEWQTLREPLTHINFFGEESLTRAVREAGLHVHSVDTAWQFVTHPERTPCVNLVASKSLPIKAPVVRTGRQQRQPLSEALPALRVNPRYYGKQLLKTLFA